MASSYPSALKRNDKDDTTLVDSIITHGLAIAQPSLWWSHLSEVSSRALDGLRSTAEVNKDEQLVEEVDEENEEEGNEEDPMNIRPVIRERTTSTSKWYNPFAAPLQKIQDAAIREPPIPALSIPTIVITPPSTRSNACRVPVQDSAFSTRLTVPNHLAFNNTFPPMTALNLPTRLPVVTRWRWRHGHWEAVLPGLEEQMHRGMFSRAVSLRRRSSRQL